MQSFDLIINVVCHAPIQTAVFILTFIPMKIYMNTFIPSFLIYIEEIKNSIAASPSEQCPHKSC